ncbi:MAG: hypothetical protein ACRDD6_12035 [Tannerellaceae bacterium]
MYTGFNLQNINITTNAPYIQRWSKLFDEQKEKTRAALYNQIAQDGIIDAAKIQMDWFPEIDAHIFISHSHKDKQLAINLACWLYENFNLKVFIDSCVWGYANDLLKQIDEIYCRKEKEDLYDYNKRNYSTSHVHMLLMTALNKMIDKTECVFFLNTDNYISLNDIKNKTLSPWIYGEIEITRTIQKKTPKRPTTSLFSRGGAINESLNKSMDLILEYPIDISHFTTINDETLKSWRLTKRKDNAALDELYKITQILTK